MKAEAGVEVMLNQQSGGNMKARIIVLTLAKAVAAVGYQVLVNSL
jgi:hypothetical protein